MNKSINLMFLKKKIERKYKNCYAFSKVLGVPKSSFFRWLHDGKVPMEYWLEISELLQLSEYEFNIFTKSKLTRKKRSDNNGITDNSSQC